MTKEQMLIAILIDTSAREDERDDAAMNLGTCKPDESVKKALETIACDINTPEIIRASCGESLAQIWIKQGEIDYETLRLLKTIALDEALATVEGYSENWYQMAVEHLIKTNN